MLGFEQNAKTQSRKARGTGVGTTYSHCLPFFRSITFSGIVVPLIHPRVITFKCVKNNDGHNC